MERRTWNDAKIWCGVLVSFAVLVGLVACTDAQIIDDRDVGRSDVARVDTGRADVAPPDAGCLPGAPNDNGEPAGCVLRRPPPRPNCSADDEDIGPIELALLSPTLGGPIGYDQDGVCSGAGGTPPSCIGPMQADLSPMGIDNSMSSQVLPTVSLAAPMFEEIFQQGVNEGRGTPLVRIEEWNGEDDDAAVTVTMALASVATPPLWDGTDVVPVADSFFAAGLPTLQDTLAYVANGTLVMAWPGNQPLAFTAGGRTVRIRLRSGFFVAQVDAEATPVLTNATIYGRWVAADGIEDLGLLGICADSLDPLVMMQRTMAILLLDGAVDLAANPMEDRVDGTSSCVAMSFALDLATSARVTWGSPVPAELDTPCSGL